MLFACHLILLYGMLYYSTGSGAAKCTNPASFIYILNEPLKFFGTSLCQNDINGIIHIFFDIYINPRVL